MAQISATKMCDRFIWVEYHHHSHFLEMLHSQLSRTCLIGSLAYQQIDEKLDVNRKSSGVSEVWRTLIVCNC